MRRRREGPTIVITLQGGGRLVGFRFWWAREVRGFDRRFHCAACLRGPFLKPSGTWAPPMNVATPYTLSPRAKALYCCGVTSRAVGGSWAWNFHAPLVPAAGESVVLPMFGDQVFIADDARLLEISPLPDGWRGLPRSFTRCRNFQFGVAQFGWPEVGR